MGDVVSRAVSNIIDIRPDRFLREMRDHGDWNKACQNAGMTIPELNELCRADIKFDRAFIECHLEYLEDKAHADTRKRIKAGRTLAYKQLAARHPDD